MYITETTEKVKKLIEFAKHYKVSIDWICGKTKNSEIK